MGTIICVHCGKVIDHFEHNKVQTLYSDLCHCKKKKK